MKSKRNFTPFVEVDVEGDQASFWCPFCLRYHYHGTGGEPSRKGGFLNYGHRVAHCQNPESPFKESGYYLKAKPRTKNSAAKGVSDE
jgi:hypothetical protein